MASGSCCLIKFGVGANVPIEGEVMRNHKVGIGFWIAREVPPFTISQGFIPDQKSEKLSRLFMSHLRIVRGGC